jgi:hypothetical protein
MATNKAQPWFVTKRADALVYSLVAERNVTVRDRRHQNLGVDLLLDLRNGKRELGRFLAIQVLAYGNRSRVESDKRTER